VTYDEYEQNGQNGGLHEEPGFDREEPGFEDEHDGLRARSEQAIGEIAQALIDNPTLHNAISAAFGAREKAIEAQQAAMGALNLSSATDLERLERRLRSFSQRLEDVEEQLDQIARDVGAIRRQVTKGSKKATSKSKS
jgi:chromosome segregation ATPase